jgi:hypothetical protein
MPVYAGMLSLTHYAPNAFAGSYTFPGPAAPIRLPGNRFSISPEFQEYRSCNTAPGTPSKPGYIAGKSFLNKACSKSDVWSRSNDAKFSSAGTRMETDSVPALDCRQTKSTATGPPRSFWKAVSLPLAGLAPEFGTHCH